MRFVGQAQGPVHAPEQREATMFLQSRLHAFASAYLENAMNTNDPNRAAIAVRKTADIRLGTTCGQRIESVPGRR